MEDELNEDLKMLLETFYRHKDGYEKASLATEDKELQRVLISISEHKELSALEIKKLLSPTTELIEDESIIRKRNLSKILSSFFNNNDNKFIIEACLIREGVLKNKLDLLIQKNYDLRIKMLLENKLSQCIAIKSLLWEQSKRF